MFKYKAFNTTEEFEEFQANNNISIYSFSPVVVEVGGSFSEANAQLGANLGIFIVYCDKEQ